MDELHLILERESDAPADWQSNRIFERDGRGIVIERIIPDDMEVSEDADND